MLSVKYTERDLMLALNEWTYGVIKTDEIKAVVEYFGKDKAVILNTMGAGYQSIYEFLSDDLRNDRDVVLKAVEDVYNLNIIPERWFDDEEIVKIAAKFDVYAVNLASYRLKDDIGFLVEVLDDNYIYRYFSFGLKVNKILHEYFKIDGVLGSEVIKLLKTYQLRSELEIELEHRTTAKRKVVKI